MNGSARSALVLPASFKSAGFIETAVPARAGPFLAYKISFAVHPDATEVDMHRAWPTLASVTYIGFAGLTLHGCSQFDDRGLFATPPEGAAGGSSAASGTGGASATSAASSTAMSTSVGSTGAGG